MDIHDPQHGTADSEGLTAEQRELLEEVAAAEDAVEAFVASFPESERRAVVAGLYFDAEGNPQTRHRRLRSV